MEMLPGVAVIANGCITFTCTESVLVQPFVLVPVTVYKVLLMG